MMCLDIMKKKWDVCIILDACRYDYFERIYREFLPKGILTKERGNINTTYWLRDNFIDYYDIIYVSGHPGINSLGVPFFRGWNARNKFKKVIDAWDEGWMDSIGTVDPQHVTKCALEVLEKWPHERMIIHYMQPHTPYRLKPFRSEFFGMLDDVKRAVNFERYYSQFPLEQIKYWYEDNLRWVLGQIPPVIEQASGIIVITADHGEVLGEANQLFHAHYVRNKDFPSLREVPYYTLIKDR